ncbi:hypothetical protein RND81_13G124100 [Saponaria officinalis]|uniref:F-box associated domain-containing protein n=1 Tax=Saponaria officinalis TaxID=3572 RepID=A0AAW1GZ52_SAPOF
MLDLDLPESVSNTMKSLISSTVAVNFHLAILDTRLCFCMMGLEKGDIWSMDEKVSWTKLVVVSAGENVRVKRLIPLIPIVYWNNGREILMLTRRSKLVSYNVRWDTWRGIEIPGVAADIEAMLFDPVFVPTKNLFKSRKTIEDT